MSVVSFALAVVFIKNGNVVQLCLTRHWLAFANQWLEMTRQFLWLDPAKVKRRCWLNTKILNDFDSTL